MKKAAMFLCLIIGLTFMAGCTMSFSAQSLTEKSTTNSWNVNFKSLHGDLAHTVKSQFGRPSTIHIQSEVDSGSLTLQVQVGERIEEFPIGEQTVDLSDWDNGEVILRIVADQAKNGKVSFTWE